MLGVRHFQKTAIDIWQGKWEHFDCDKKLFISSNYATRSHLPETENGEKVCDTPVTIAILKRRFQQDLQKNKTTEPSSNKKHLGLVVPDETHSFSNKDLADKLFQTLKQALEKDKLHFSFRRVSFLLDSQRSYESYQEALFNVFSE